MDSQLTPERARAIKQWAERHYPYLKLSRIPYGFNVTGFKTGRELYEFRTVFTRRFSDGEQVFRSFPDRIEDSQWQKRNRAPRRN